MGPGGPLSQRSGWLPLTSSGVREGDRSQSAGGFECCLHAVSVVDGCYFCLVSHTAAYTGESLSGRVGLVLGHDLNHGVCRGSI